MRDTKKLLWPLAAFGLVAMLTAGLVIWMANQRRPTPPVVVDEPVVAEPVVLGHELTFAESRIWGDEVPHGTQELDHVMFVCDGALRTAGWRQPRAPGAILGIPIHHKGTKLHLLHGAENSPGNSVGAVHHYRSRTGEIDHVWLRTGDLAATKAFYETVAPAVGIELVRETPSWPAGRASTSMSRSACRHRRGRRARVPRGGARGRLPGQRRETGRHARRCQTRSVPRQIMAAPTASER